MSTTTTTMTLDRARRQVPLQIGQTLNLKHSQRFEGTIPKIVPTCLVGFKPPHGFEGQKMKPVH